MYYNNNHYNNRKSSGYGDFVLFIFGLFVGALWLLDYILQNYGIYLLICAGIIGVIYGLCKICPWVNRKYQTYNWINQRVREFKKNKEAIHPEWFIK